MKAKINSLCFSKELSWIQFAVNKSTILCFKLKFKTRESNVYCGPDPRGKTNKYLSWPSNRYIGIL